MKHRLFRLAPVLLSVAMVTSACESSDGNVDESGQPPSSPSQELVIPDSTTPVELDLNAPKGFKKIESERQAPVSDQYMNYVFELESGDPRTKIEVTTYALDEIVAEDDADRQVGIMKAYYRNTGEEYSTMSSSAALVNGRFGYMMFSRIEGEGRDRLTQQNYFLYAGNNLIHITLQWTRNEFEASLDGRNEILETFPFPEWWTK